LRLNSIRIGAGSGFQGDRLEPAVILASQGELDFLALECLAERTIALAQLRKLADPAGGFDPLLETRMRALLPLALRHGFRIVTNMGAANPLGAGRKVISLAKNLGLRVKVAVLSGDDVLSLLEPGMRTIEARGAPLSEYGALVSANAYFGAEEILPALATGAHVVVTGRVADPSLFVAPIAHAFGWRLDDWERLGRATAIGHLLECAGQVTGGYFAEPGLKDISPSSAFPGATSMPRATARSARSPAPAARSRCARRRSSSCTKSPILAATSRPTWSPTSPPCGCARRRRTGSRLPRAPAERAPAPTR
jgi:hypothetical protein